MKQIDIIFIYIEMRVMIEKGQWKNGIFFHESNKAFIIMSRSPKKHRHLRRIIAKSREIIYYFCYYSKKIVVENGTDLLAYFSYGFLTFSDNFN